MKIHQLDDLQRLGNLLVSVHRMRVVESLAKRAQMPGELARTLGKSAAATVRQINLLEDTGLVTRADVPNSVGRATLASLNLEEIQRLVLETQTWVEGLS